MADDWRVTATLTHAGRARRVARAVGKRLAADGLYRRLGYRIAASADGPRLYLYADTEDPAREADRVVREVLALRQLSARLTLGRWHPVAQEVEGGPSADTRPLVAGEVASLFYL